MGDDNRTAEFEDRLRAVRLQREKVSCLVLSSRVLSCLAMCCRVLCFHALSCPVVACLSCFAVALCCVVSSCFACLPSL
jgi:hypothetical protein